MQKDFQDLKVWQDAKRLTASVYELSRGFPEQGFSLQSQLRDAAVAVAGTIAKVSAQYGTQDKIAFLLMSRGACYELKSNLLLALELGFLDMEQVKPFITEYELLVKRINAFVAFLRKQQKEGGKK